MNKKILAVAVAAIMASGPILATADNTLSGYYLYRLESIDSDVQTNNYGEITLNGSEDIGGGLTGVYQMNFELVAGGDVNVAGQNFLGLAGGFGTVLMGKLNHPYRTAGDAFRGGVFGDSVAVGMQSEQRINSDGALAYVSPNFSGVTVSAAVVPFNNAAGDNKLPYSLSAVYNQGPFLLTVAYEDLKEVRENDFIQAEILDGLGETDQALETASNAPRVGQAILSGFRYQADGLMAGLMVETREDKSSFDTGKRMRVLLPVQYEVTPQVTVRGAVMYTEFDPTGADKKVDWTDFAIGAQYNFSSRTLARFNVMVRDGDNPELGDDQTDVGLTIIHNF